MVIPIAILIAAVVLYVGLKAQLAARKIRRFYHGRADGTEVIYPITVTTRPRFYYGRVR